jgi:HAE1 family hydrophobic/amphiphilic exporter-1
MNISREFIERPVMTILIMAAILIFGAFGYATLPVSELPNVDFPTITVSASLPGADPETMASAVAAPLENQFSTVNGISSMTSSSSQGSTSITLQFDLDRNIDSAAQDVQSAISAAQRRLPRSMQTPPSFRKVNPTDSPIFFISLRSDSMPLSKLDEFAETLLARQLSTVEGVAQVNVYGSAKYAIRVQADPTALAARQIGIDQVSTAIAAANSNEATGALNGSKQAAIIQTEGQLNNAEEFRHQIIAYRNGAPVALGDVAKVMDSVENPYSQNAFQGHPAITLAIQRQPGSNTIAVVDNIKAVLPQFQLSLPPTVKMETLYDRSESIRASVGDVEITLLIAAVLVIAVIFLFLRQISATVIASLALPLAVIGTFAGMWSLEYSLDNLSLMALTLSVGFVVDDAIVMLENIVRHIEDGEEPYQAALKGSGEIGFTILSMTVSLAAVFIPVVFMGGIVGRLLHEFAVTIILAILVSGFVSVTLTPMLCARLLKSEHHKQHNAIYQWSERNFGRLQDAYDRSLKWALANRPVVIGALALSLLVSIGLFYIMPQDFLPSDDTGILQASTQAANGTGYNQMVAYQNQVADIINNDPNVYGAQSSVSGSNGAAGANAGRISIFLKPRSERALSADEVVRELRQKVAHVPGINVFIQNPPTIRIGGRSARSQYQYTLMGLDLDELRDVSDKLVAELKTNPDFVEVNSDLDQAMPSVKLDIDRQHAAALGVTPQQIESALGSAFGGQQVSQINTSANQYEVILELLPKFRADPSALSLLYVTSSNGSEIPLTSVVKISDSTEPLSVNHSGEVPAVTISFDMAAGKALSDAVSGIHAVSTKIGVPATIQGSFQGTAAAFQSSTQNMGFLLMIAMIVVYIILGILYESFIHPLTILSGLPSAAVGALLTLWIFGLPLTLYAFVGMVMLIGIVKKNAIMMIDFALHRERSEHVPPEQAIYEAAVIRFRPIMMTTMAALMGTLPIAIGLGAGAQSRQPLGLCVAGGLLLSQLLTLYITPVLYIYLDRFGNWLGLYGTERHAVPLPGE